MEANILNNLLSYWGELGDKTRRLFRAFLTWV